MTVGVAHVGLDSSDQAVDDHAEDTEEEAEAHASGGEDESGEQHSDGRSEQDGDGATLARWSAQHHSLRYIKRGCRSY